MMKQQQQREVSTTSCNIHHVICITLATIVCYLNALNCGLVFDDNSAIKYNKDLKPSSPFSNLFVNDFWGTPIKSERSHKSYRPLTVATFRWNFLVHGLEPLGYHLTNVILHVVVCILYYKLCLRFLQKKTSFLAALLFAVHPIHTEAVTGVVGRAEILSAIFFLFAFLTFLNTYNACSNYSSSLKVATLTTAAMLCKEQGLVVIPLCILTDIFILRKHIKMNWSICHQRVWTRRVLLLSTCLLSLGFMRAYVMGFTLPSFNRFDNPASNSATPSRQMTFAYLAAYNAWLLVFPSSLCCDWTMLSIPLVKSLLDARNLFTFTFFCFLYKFVKSTKILNVYERTDKVALLGIMMTVIPFVPGSNMLFTVGFVIAERILYLPSMGFCFLVAHGFSKLQQRFCSRTNCLTVVLFILLTSHACKTIRRNSDWKDEKSLYSSGLRINPENAKLLNNLGHVFETAEKYQEATAYYAEAIRVQPDDVGGYINMGRVYSSLNLFKEAEITLKKANTVAVFEGPAGKLTFSYNELHTSIFGPPIAFADAIKPNEGKALIYPSINKEKLPINHLKVFLTLANVISQNNSRLEEANRLYQEVIKLREDYVEAYLNRGDILIKSRRFEEAKETYKQALKYNLNQADLYYNLAIVYAQEGEVLQALDHLNKALEIEPDHEPSLLNSALIIQEHQVSTETLTAYRRLLKLVQSRDTYDEKVYFNLGMLSLTAGSAWNAEYWLRKAVQVKEDFKSALFNLALLLSDEERPLEAVTFINQLLKFHPNHTKALILMGDIYVNSMNDLESAEQIYNRILKIDPSDVQGLHNLCVIHYKKSELLQAEKCLLETLKLAPEKEYVLKHLKLVRDEMKKSSESIMDNTDVLQDQSILNAFEYSSR